MGKLGWSLLILYLTAAAGYGGWRGRDLWLGWGVWCLLAPPLAAAALQVIGECRRNPHWGIIRIHLVMAVFGVAALGGAVLVLAWVVAEATEQWSAQPAVRAVAGALLGAAGGGLALLGAKSRKEAEPPPTSASEGARGPGEPAVAPDEARRHGF
jgi:hypothetical protein